LDSGVDRSSDDLDAAGERTSNVSSAKGSLTQIVKRLQGHLGLGQSEDHQWRRGFNGHQFYTAPDDVGPLNFWMREAELAGHVASGFADDLHEVRQREAKVFVRVIRVAREARGLADGLFAVSSMCPT
jgi:hypothetical protein